MSEIQYGPLTLVGEDEYIVTACRPDATRAVIPVAVDGIPVVAIGECAFRDCRALREVAFPTDEEYDAEEHLALDWFSVEIDGNAFMNCTALREVKLPERVSIVGHGAFYGCRALKRVILPRRCYVASYAFSECVSLREVTPVNMVSEGVFRRCESLTQLPITVEVTEIETDAFEHCYGLADITIPRHVKKIGSEAFSGCRGLRRVTFESPDGWYSSGRYSLADGERTALDLADPRRNARRLAGMDFDDGVSAWVQD